MATHTDPAITGQAGGQVEIALTGMTCASCANRIERKLNKLDGVTATVNYATEKAKVTYSDGVTTDALVAAVEIAAEQPELFLGGPGAGCAPAQVAVALLGAALAAGRLELGHPDPRRHAGGAFRAGRPVQHVLRPPEALLGQRVVQRLGIVALQGGEKLAFHPTCQIGAGLRRSHIELRSNRKCVTHLFPRDVCGERSKPPAFRQAPRKALRAVTSGLRG